MTRLDGLMLWVADVATSVDFYERAFGLERAWVRDEGDYAQLSTGETTLQFAAESAAPASGVDIRLNRADGSAPGMQLSLVVDDVAAGFERAVTAGAAAVAEPVTKRWGQVVAYVRDLDGVLVELSTAGD